MSNLISNGRLNLEQQKKRAKELLHQFKASQDSALNRFQQHHPQAKHLNSTELVSFQPKLSDAQLVIARENNLPSWAKLKAHIQRLDRIKQDIALGITSPADADLQTLHLRCGSDIQNDLNIAGFSGDFLEFADPYCQGPVPDCANLSQFLDVRASFIADAYGIALKDARKRLEREYSRLQTSPTYDRVVLWFEHDTYDQLVLAYVLHYFWQSPSRPKHLELICIGAFPGIQRFVGLGQLSAEVLRSLWEQRQPITHQHLQLGHRVWQALTASSPLGLMEIIDTRTPLIPTMAHALRRHLQELPWVEDGLSLTERLTLEILAQQGAITAHHLFKTLVLEKEPLPYLGDTMYWYVLNNLHQSENPPFEITAETRELPWSQRLLQLTETGQALLRGEVNWREMQKCDRWIGGIHLTRNQSCWMWNEQQRRPILLVLS
ncbi:MAG: DUF1835 domain-containing protein [Cyanobacteriota bacterium]